MMKKIALIILFALTLGCFESNARSIASSKSESELTQSSPKIVCGQGCASVTIENIGNSTVGLEIYSITGQLVKKLSLGEGTTTIDLPRGCYIVRCASWSKKIVVS